MRNYYHAPHALHEGCIQGLVVILKVDPAAQPGNSPLPVLGVTVDAHVAHAKSGRCRSNCTTGMWATQDQAGERE